MITLTAAGPRPVVAHEPVAPAAAAGWAGAAPLACRLEGAGDGPSRRHRPGGRRGRASGLPARDHAAAIPGRHSRPDPIRALRPRIWSADRLSNWPPKRRSPTASSCTPRSTRAPGPTTDWATTPRSWFRPPVSWWPAPASCTSRSRPATTRTPTSGPDPPTTTPTRCTSPTAWTPASACRRAGTNGSRKSPATTHSAAPKSSSTQRRSARSRCSPRSTRSRCGSR